MSNFLLANEPTMRLGAFLSVLVAVALAEAAWPRRTLRVIPKWGRWAANLGIVAVNSVVLRLLFPILAAGMAAIASERGVGLLNTVALPAWLKIALAIAALDFVIYLQHVMFHAVPALWRLHMMHHADADFDVTTGARFHPIEIALSMVLKLGTVLALGAPAAAVVLFEIVLNATAMFNHANLALPPSLDRWLRLVLVTPDMHRIHHSATRRETNSNFGFSLPWWDRLCGTYRAQPERGHEAMTIGLSQFQDHPRQNLLWLLALPFVGPLGDTPIGGDGPS